MRKWKGQTNPVELAQNNCLCDKKKIERFLPSSWSQPFPLPAAIHTTNLIIFRCVCLYCNNNIEIGSKVSHVFFNKHITYTVIQELVFQNRPGLSLFVGAYVCLNVSVFGSSSAWTAGRTRVIFSPVRALFISLVNVYWWRHSYHCVRSEPERSRSELINTTNKIG